MFVLFIYQCMTILEYPQGRRWNMIVSLIFPCSSGRFGISTFYPHSNEFHHIRFFFKIDAHDVISTFSSNGGGGQHHQEIRRRQRQAGNLHWCPMASRIEGGMGEHMAVDSRQVMGWRLGFPRQPVNSCSDHRTCIWAVPQNGGSPKP